MSSECGGTLFLVPNTLGAGDPETVVPVPVLARARSLSYYIAENEKSARAFLKRIGTTRALQDIRIGRLDHNTPASAIPELLEPVVRGADAGLLSEAGMPAVADPGAALIRAAHERGLRVAPLSGPSSLLLALAASGLNGQSFAFHGYLPIEAEALSAALKDLETESRRLRRTQIFIETPYRNDRTLAAALRALAANTLVCVATDLTLESESVRTQDVAAWRRQPPALHGRPTVFLLLAE